MRNVRPEQLKKAICIDNENFDYIVHYTLGHDVNVEYSLDGICISTDDDVICWEEICTALCKYFDVKEITSIHIDDCDYPVGVWIIYKEEE